MSYYRPQMMTKVRSSHVMAAAKGRPCTLRIASIYPGYSCASDETSVMCHFDNVGGKGMGTKVTDIGGGIGCKHCHDILAGEDWKRLEFITETYPMVFCQRLISSLIETHAILVDEGLLVVPGAKLIS